MFGFKNGKDYLIEEYENIIEQKNKQIGKLTEQKNQMFLSELANADYVIDFNLLNPFSIERIIKNDAGTTVLGYFNTKGEPRVWDLQCSFDMHQKLSNEFKEYIFNKYDEVE
jgi:hypothetical protein